jgi:hypothetical protein
MDDDDDESDEDEGPEEEVDEAADSRDGDDGNRGGGRDDSRVAFTERRYSRQVKGLRDELMKERRLREERDQKLRDKDRDTLLMNALNSVSGGIVDGGLPDALELMRKKAKYVGEGDDGQWVFVTKEGAEIEDFHQGIEQDLPPYLRKPVSHGGSGSGGGGAARTTQIDSKKKDLAKAEERAQRTARDEDWVVARKLKREVETLEGTKKPEA